MPIAKITRRQTLVGTASLGVVAALPLLSSTAGAYVPPKESNLGYKLQLSEPPQPASDIAIRTGDGQDTSLIEMNGKTVLATFWATWCGVCIAEMPVLDELAASYSGTDLIVAPLSLDRSLSDIPPYYARKNLTNLPIFHDYTNVLAAVMGVRGTPTSFLIDRRNTVVAKVEGNAHWMSPEGRKFIEHYLAQTA